MANNAVKGMAALLTLLIRLGTEPTRPQRSLLDFLEGAHIRPLSCSFHADDTAELTGSNVERAGTRACGHTGLLGCNALPEYMQAETEGLSLKAVSSPLLLLLLRLDFDPSFLRAEAKAALLALAVSVTMFPMPALMKDAKPALQTFGGQGPHVGLGRVVPQVCFSQVSLGLAARAHAIATDVHGSMYVFQYTGLRCTLSWDGVPAERYSVADAYQPPAIGHAEKGRAAEEFGQAAGWLLM
ncbi:MAG: hypothetical protein FRX49_01959 [Trebouxia sp. A1-2]|nr:MAG: hypothetical protein FRX49_01959 [Trebouxia sp. A1-2]